MKLLGVAVSSGAIYYGALAVPDETQGISYIAEAPERLIPAAGLTGAQRLADTHQRIAQDIRVLQPDAVTVVATRKNNQWVYRDAFERISMISALMLTCVEQGIPLEEWTTERIGKLVGTPAPKLTSFDHMTVGFERIPTYWNAGRGPAFAAAMACATELRSVNGEGQES
ncbi:MULTISPECIES: hypothetical protein [unclassified Streptomyces]|uniref:hypothetical protein n=1 Tax=unclassified Streptomyces TaxID=2593676 RepID=UPI000BAC64D6|nr:MULTISPECIES: hypothetical protein [unclassified Streptomyces]ASY33584.1 hypothetical protein CAC01_13610 [Streptomyces sp. CLI2509]MYX23569.1 hypothetical protein [Streptomyces sp. SID8380]